ncbi:MAG: SGNH/GDSL hydrolase family protein [Cellulosilyticaceae bacterium]
MSKTIVCFGDSNTHGYCAETNGRFNEKERWTRLLQEHLGEAYIVIEEGLSGRTTVFEDPIFEGLNGMQGIFQCLMSHEPVDLLVIMLGTNDVKERFGVNAANIAKGMNRLVQKAMSIHDAWRHEPNILIIAPGPIEKGFEKTAVAFEMGKGCVEKSEQLAPYYKEVANNLGCHFLDAHTIPQLTMSPIDCMHLSLEAHAALGRYLAELIPQIV